METVVTEEMSQKLNIVFHIANPVNIHQFCEEKDQVPAYFDIILQYLDDQSSRVTRRPVKYGIVPYSAHLPRVPYRTSPGHLFVPYFSVFQRRLLIK